MVGFALWVYETLVVRFCGPCCGFEFLLCICHERIEALGIFMLDRSLALKLEIGPWAASEADSPS
jgi:hypothetical protein